MSRTRKQRVNRRSTRKRQTGGISWNPFKWGKKAQVQPERRLSLSEQNRPVNIPKKPQRSLWNQLTRKRLVQQATIPVRKVAKNSYLTTLQRNRANLQPYTTYSSDEYQSMKDAYEREFMFLYEKIKNQQKPVIRNPNNKLSQREKSELKMRILELMYDPLKDMFVYPIENMNTFIKSLTGLDENTFNIQMEAYVKFIPKVITMSAFNRYQEPKKQKIPIPAARGIARLIGPALYTDEELTRITDMETKLCRATPFTNVVTSMKQGACVALSYSIQDLLENLQPSGKFGSDPNVMYVVIQPTFHPKATEQKYRGRVYYNVVNLRQTDTNSIELGDIGSSKVLADVFANKGLELIHPRLGCLLQMELPALWNKSYFNVSSLDKTDCVVVLTLQKYAAIRRYMWSKDPALASQVYEVDPTTIADELRAPYLTLPGQSFNSNAFFKEFRNNQLWAGGSVRYTSYSDPGLQKILPSDSSLNQQRQLRSQNNANYAMLPWYIPGESHPVEQTPIPKISEEDSVRAKLQSSTIGTSSGVFIPVNEEEEINYSLGLNPNFKRPNLSTSTTFVPMTATRKPTTLKNPTSWIRDSRKSRKQRRN
jgi:hypothetical protein